MKFIEKIILKNFQSHHYSELDLSRGVNVIVGPSDSGKTAIMRALRWNLFNEPSGVDFVREGEREVSVIVKFQDRIEVERRRSKSKNQYILRQPNEEEIIFEGFGTHVPEEIREATAIYKVMLDDKKALPLNFSDQLEGPFLLQESDTYKAQAIGRMVGVDILDETMRQTLRDKKQVGIRKDLLLKDYEALEESLKSFQNLNRQIKQRDDLLNILERVDLLNNKLEQLNVLRRRSNHLFKEHKAIEDVLRRFASVEALKELLISITNKSTHYRMQKLLYSDVRENRKQLQETKKVLQAMATFHELEESRLKLLPTLARYEKLKPLDDRKKTVNLHRKQIATLLSTLKGIEEISTETIQKKRSLLQQYLQLDLANKELQQRITLGREFLKKYEQVINAGDKIASSQGLFEYLRNLNDVRSLVSDFSRKKETAKANIKNAALKCNIAMNDYLSLLNEQGTCPLCHQSIDTHDLDVIRRHLEE